MIIEQKLYDFLYNFLRESKLFEMARSRSDKLEKIHELDQTLAEHLVKILAFEPTQTLNYWKTEVLNKARLCYRYAIKDSSIDKDALVSHLWKGPLGSINDLQELINEILEDNPNLVVDGDIRFTYRRLGTAYDLFYSCVKKKNLEEFNEWIRDWRE